MKFFIPKIFTNDYFKRYFDLCNYIYLATYILKVLTKKHWFLEEKSNYVYLIIKNGSNNIFKM